jgi:hypothetical protein
MLRQETYSFTSGRCRVDRSGMKTTINIEATTKSKGASSGSEADNTASQSMKAVQAEVAPSRARGGCAFGGANSMAILV